MMLKNKDQTPKGTPCDGLLYADDDEDVIELTSAGKKIAKLKAAG